MSEFKCKVIIDIEIDSKGRHCTFNLRNKDGSFRVESEGLEYKDDPAGGHGLHGGENPAWRTPLTSYVDCGPQKEFQTKKEALEHVKAKVQAYLEDAFKEALKTD